VVRAAQSQLIVRTPYLDNDIVRLAFQATDTTSSRSGASLQLIRTYDRGLSHIPTDRGLVPASPLRSLLNVPASVLSFKLDYWHSDGMPHWLSSIERHLSTFGLRSWTPGMHKYLHYRRWFQTNLSDYVRARLTDTATARTTLWNGPFLYELLKEHITGRKNYVNEINTVLTLEAVDRLLLKQSHEGTA